VPSRTGKSMKNRTIMMAGIPTRVNRTIIQKILSVSDLRK